MRKVRETKTGKRKGVQATKCESKTFLQSSEKCVTERDLVRKDIPVCEEAKRQEKMCVR